MVEILDNGSVFDLSKVFDCIPHDLTIAKLEIYGFHIDALKLIHDFYQTESKELKLMMQIACGRIYFMVSHRDPCSVFYYSIYIYMTYSIFWKIWTLQAMRMILQFIR